MTSNIDTRDPERDEQRERDLSEHLANERTMLAYVRTSIALLGFGLSLNRFGAFLRDLKRPPGAANWLQRLHDADRMGMGMMLLGLVLLVWAAIHFVRVMHAIERHDEKPKQLGVWLLSGGVFLLGFAVVAATFIGR